MLSRGEYLADLAEDYGLPIETVLAAADALGSAEDLDGLLDRLRELASEGLAIESADLDWAEPDELSLGLGGLAFEPEWIE
jgi:hypothetical protein